MAAISYKAQALAADIQSTLTVQLSALATPLAVTEAFDTDNNPFLTIGTNVAGTAGGILKVKAVVWPLAFDALGNAANIYTPHVMQLVFEAVSSGGVDPNTVFTKQAIIAEALKRGTRVELYHSANGTAPSTAAITGAPDAVLEPDTQYPMISDM